MSADDPYFLALYEHQMTSTLRDSCSCGAGDMDTLQPSGVAIQRWRRHLALVLRGLAVEDVQQRLRDKGWSNTAARLRTLAPTENPLPTPDPGWSPIAATVACDWCGECDWCDSLGRENESFGPEGGAS